jgi:hypothetical protein
MAGHDPGRFAEVMDWPLRELFLGFLDRLRERARDNYELELLVWAILAPYQKHQTRAPNLPRILRD